MAREHGPTPEIGCPRCKAALSIAEVLSNCSVCWPNQRWLLFECPHCHATAHVEVGAGRLSLGDLDGAPGPAFFLVSTSVVKGLRCRAARDGMRITYRRLTVTVPAKA